MSIYDFVDKIKGKFYIDRYTLLCLIIIIIVSIGSFGLGRLSVINNEIEDIQSAGSDYKASVGDWVGESKQNTKALPTGDLPKEKMYIASKNGKLYYSIGCSGAKRISDKNSIWFATKEDAEKSGYSLSSTCK